MSRTAFLAALLAATATAQSSFAVPGFTYVGCVSAPVESFPRSIAFIQAPTPQDCQNACGESGFVALGNGCHCDETPKPVKFEVVDEAKCNVPCRDNDPKKGYCGSGSSGKPQYYNLYKKGEIHPEPPVEDCDEHPPIKEKVIVPSTTIKTIFGCPPDVVDCPLHKVTPPPIKPIQPIGPCVPDHCQPACPPHGCPPCPPEGCPPPCHPACPVVSPPVVPPKHNTTVPVCPGCVVPVTTEPVCPGCDVPATTKAPVTTHPLVPVPTTTGPAIVVGGGERVRAAGAVGVAAMAAVGFWVL